MAFLSLYRKYRPHNFEDLVGQQHVVKTLKNALEYNRIAHAYLFAGPRGTGKTSTAKIYAQALNCVEGPTATPCGECENCKKIQSGRSIDVIEIDAASNRGIDEIRDLREKVKFYPGEGKYKVYIIDEVHMLTTGAFNALLKTLEEPPGNVVFILATTEPHKVIDTILSRCQRFDFTLLSNNDIRQRLVYICKAEDVTYDQKSLNLIASASKGGLRDAISLLDQAISYTNNELSGTEVQEMLGKVDITVLNTIFKYIVEQDTAKALKIVNEIIDSGKGISIFVSDMIGHLRKVMLYKECGSDSNILNLTDDMMNRIKDVAGLVQTVQMVRYLEILTGIEKKLTYADQPRIILELGLIKMATTETDTSLEGLTMRVADLEYNLKQIEKDGIKVNQITGEAKSKERIKDKADRKDSDKTSEKTFKETGHEGEKANINKKENKEKSFTLDDIMKAWPVILREVKEENISVQALLVEGKPVSVEGNAVIIQFPSDKNFHKKGAERESGLIQKNISKVIGQNCQLQFQIEDSEGNHSKKKDKTVNEDNSGKKSKDHDDIVDKVVKAFNGQVIKVNHQILENE